LDFSWGSPFTVLQTQQGNWRYQTNALIERGRGWPWNGYELRLMKDAGKYPSPRLVTRR